MERSRKIFLKIASASNKVITTANEYADRKDMCGVQRSHFQLEAEMRRISVACECIVDILGKPTPPDGLAFDVRLQDWLDTDEPQKCLDTLIQMESLLQKDASSWMPRLFRIGRGKAPIEDCIKEAAEHFGSRKGYFHFLFSTEIWNNDSDVQQQQDVLHPRDHISRGEASNVLEESLSFAVQTEINTTVLDLVVHQGGHAHHVIQEVSNVPDQTLPVPVQAGLNPTPDTTIQQCGHTVGRRRHEAMPDRQQKEEEDTKQVEEILKWLDGLNCAEEQDVTLSFRQPGTCNWLFDTAQYKMWRDGDGSFLWLRGKPGAGKSVLASSVIDSLETSRREGEILAFFYCNFRSERSTSSAEVLRSILSQLLRELRGSAVNTGNLIKDLVKAKERGGRTLKNAKELAGFASCAAGLSSERPLVVVDALDECKDVRALLQALVAIKSHVRLLVTSRPLHVIMGDLSGLPFISMDDMPDELSADIELHVTRELDARHRLRDLDTGLKAQIRSVLCTKAGGMFRWIQCSINTLDRCVTRKEVWSALDSLPRGLDETYERILLGIDAKSQEGQLARRALIWLVAALRPLRLNELMVWLSINLQTRTLDPDFGPIHNGALLDACGSLVTYSERTGIIILSHFSVKEYLIGEFILTKLPHYHINWERANLQLVQSCMCYISVYLKRAQEPGTCNSAVIDVSRECHIPSKLGDPMSQLRDYVLNHTFTHLQHIGPHFESVLHDIKVLEADIEQHARIWNHIRLFAKRHSLDWPTLRHDFTLYILLRSAPYEHLRTFLRRTSLNPKEGTNPLVYAAYFKEKECARILLSRGARLNSRGWEIDRIRQVLPIEVALRNQDYAMVTLFLEQGSTVPPHIFTDSFFDPKKAIIPSFIAKMLLQTDAFAEVANDLLNKPVSRPVNIFECCLEDDVDEQDLIAIIRRFVQVVDGHFAFNSDGEETLLFAIGRHHFAVARYLLTLGASLPSDSLVRLYCLDRWTTLLTIRFLIENGADVLARTSKGTPALPIVLWYCRDESDALEAAKLLIGHGSDPLEPNHDGDTPLICAVRQGFVSVAQYLLCLGTPLPSDVLLHMNLSRGMYMLDDVLSMPRLLVESGANVLVHTTDGVPLLHCVLRGFWGWEYDHDARKIVEWLVSQGCDPTERNPDGRTALHIAVEQELVSVAQYLLSLGVPVSPDLLPLALKFRWARDNVPMVRLLIKNGAGVRVRTKTGESMLRLVLKALATNADYYLEIAKLLVSRGCDPFEANASGETPLHLAIGFGRISVAQHLVSVGARLSPDRLYTLDSWKGWLDARKIRFLVENGLDATTLTSAGDSMLHIALKSGYLQDDDVLEAVKTLIGRGCDPLGTNSRGKTPLHIAAKHGQFSAARYILSLGVPLEHDLLLVALNSTPPEYQKETFIRFLVEKGANVHARTATGNSALHILLQSARDEYYILNTATLLINHGCDPLGANSGGKTPLHVAAKRGHLIAVQYLLSFCVAPGLPSDLLVTMDGWNPCRTAQMIRLLAENGADVLAHTSDGDSVLHIISKSLYDDDEALEVAKFLVGCGCDPLGVNFRGNTPLYTAIERGHVSVAQYLLSLGAPLPCDALFLALRMRRQELLMMMMKFLVNHGASVLTRASNGDTLLHIAAGALFPDDNHANHALEIVKFLIQCGCDPATSNMSGETLLHIAFEQKCTKLVEYLLSLNISYPSDILFTAMQSDFLSRGKLLDIIKALVASGCDTQTRDSAGHTPLHVAATKGHVAVVDFLLSVVDGPPPEDLLSVAELAPPNLQGEMRSILNSRLRVARCPRPRSKSPELPPAKHFRYS